MGSKWGSNEDIHIGDIFQCWFGPYVGQPDSDYYQVAALRGRTQVVLRPLRRHRRGQSSVLAQGAESAPARAIYDCQ